MLDGFTIQGGNANSTANQDRGGGLLMLAASNATIRNCIVRNNRCTFGGGAGYINASSPVFEDCTFENNLGGSFGGAFDMATNVGAIFRRCTFSGNSAARAGGLEIFGGSNVQVTNCVFRNNTATGATGGGAILVLSSSSVTVRASTIVGNTSPTASGAGVVISGSTGTIADSILYSNTGSGGAQTSVNQTQGATVTYSCVQGGLAGTGNISAAPLFVDAPNGDFHLLAGSPGIDAGSNTALPAGTTTDRSGAPRLADDPATIDTGLGTAPIVDLGAFEYQPPLFRAFCAGDGTLSDHTTDCPCANFGASGNGCANSVNASGANLAATGAAATDDVVLNGSGMPANVACIYLQGDALEDAIFGDGVRCAGGALVRLRTKVNAGGASSFPEAGVDTVTLSARGGVTVGSGAVRYYQTYYRNSAAAFCPPETFNVTNGWQIAW
ncbi:MAG: right-handed parallel beta-helix repeat-containing protein [Planctomycetes bacterium]|nr:right-handed parallel beta-helix repeat-containing protein [Planctomycetota bacterium]